MDMTNILIFLTIGICLSLILIKFYRLKKEREHIEYLNKLKVDYKPNIKFYRELESGVVNWDDYDSEKVGKREGWI